MTRTPPQHGERRCYLSGCRRPECAAANIRYCKRYRLTRARNGPRRVDATPATTRVHHWHTQGYSQRQIADAAGCSPRVIHNLLAGDLHRINPTTAAGILRADPTTAGLPEHTYTDATGTIRRGRALMAIGHTRDDIAGLMGMAPDALGRVLNGRTLYVQARTAQAMAGVYERLTRKPGGSARTRTIAAQRGWPGPMAWGDNIDDPNARPDSGPAAGRSIPRWEALGEDAHELVNGQGMSWEAAAARLGVTVANLQRSHYRWRKRTTETTEQAEVVAS